MRFERSIPERLFRDYTDYRSLLRQDFQHRCAYCLMHEYYLGGEAGCCIDHHRPVHGRYVRPDLVAAYNNLQMVRCSGSNFSPLGPDAAAKPDITVVLRADKLSYGQLNGSP